MFAATRSLRHMAADQIMSNILPLQVFFFLFLFSFFFFLQFAAIRMWDLLKAGVIMGLLYPPPLLVPPYLPSINATAGASCNNTCTSEPPARERETGEERAVEGEPGGWRLRRTRMRRWGRGERKTKRWWDGVTSHVRRRAMWALRVRRSALRVEGGVTVTSQITHRMRQRLLFPIAMAIGDESCSESSESGCWARLIKNNRLLSTPFSVSCRVLGLVSVPSCFPPRWVRLLAVAVSPTKLLGTCSVVYVTLSPMSVHLVSHIMYWIFVFLSFPSHFVAIEFYLFGVIKVCNLFLQFFMRSHLFFV